MTLRIDPYNVRGTNVSELFEKVTFIPLETTKESTFGRINTLKMINDSFLVFDYETNALLIFNSDGKYINKIRAGDNKVSSFNLSGFSVVSEGDTKYILINNDNSKLYYDEHGKFVKSSPQDNRRYKEIIPLNDDMGLANGWRENDSTYWNFALFRKGKIFGKYYPRPSTNNVQDVFLTANGDNQMDLATNYFLTRPYCYDIYRIKLPTISLSYRLLFPKANSMPPDFATNPIYVGEANRFKYQREQENIIMGIGNVFLFGDNLFFKISATGGSEKLRPESFVYNLKTKETITLKHIEPDGVSHFLPVTDRYHGFLFMVFGFQYCSGQHLYTSCASEDLFKYKDQYFKKNSVFDPVLTNYFKTQTVRSNPVIIKLKPRSKS